MDDSHIKQHITIVLTQRTMTFQIILASLIVFDILLLVADCYQS